MPHHAQVKNPNIDQANPRALVLGPGESVTDIMIQPLDDVAAPLSAGWGAAASSDGRAPMLALVTTQRILIANSALHVLCQLPVKPSAAAGAAGVLSVAWLGSSLVLLRENGAIEYMVAQTPSIHNGQASGVGVELAAAATDDAAGPDATSATPLTPAGGDHELQGVLNTMTYISEACRVRWPMAVVRPIGSIAPLRLLTGIGGAIVGFKADRLLFVGQGFPNGGPDGNGFKPARFYTRPLLPLEPLVVGVAALASAAGGGEVTGRLDLLRAIVSRHAPPVSLADDAKLGEGAGINAGATTATFETLLDLVDILAPSDGDGGAATPAAEEKVADLFGGGGFVASGGGSDGGSGGANNHERVGQELVALALTVGGVATLAEKGTGESFRRRPWICADHRVQAAVKAGRWEVALVELLHTDPDLQEAAKSPGAQPSLPPAWSPLSRNLQDFAAQAEAAGAFGVAALAYDMAGDDWALTKLALRQATSSAILPRDRNNREAARNLADNLRKPNLPNRRLYDVALAYASASASSKNVGIEDSKARASSIAKDVVEMLGGGSAGSSPGAVLGKLLISAPTPPRRLSLLDPRKDYGDGFAPAPLSSAQTELIAAAVEKAALATPLAIYKSVPKAQRLNTLLLDRTEEWFGRARPEVRVGTGGAARRVAPLPPWPSA